MTTKTAAIKPSENKGLCKLVSPSVVATALQVSMNYPSSLIHGSTTECLYRAKEGSAATLINYETQASTSTFDRTVQGFEGRGFKLGRVTDLGDQAYYFDEQTGQATVSTVVVLKDSLQILVTGSGQVDQIGAIARYTLNEFETTHSSVTPSSG
jgi:hypothetical protein